MRLTLRTSVVMCCVLCLIAGCGRSQLSPALPGPEAEARLVVEQYRGIDVVGNSVVVKLDQCDDGNEKAILNSLQEFARNEIFDNQAQVQQVGNFCWFLVTSSERRTDQLLQTFRRDPPLKFNSNQGLVTIVHAEPNFIIRLDPKVDEQPGGLSPDDDLFEKGQLWGLLNRDYKGIDIDVVEAWKTNQGSPEIVVGVVDTGLEYDHPDLIENVWCAPRDFEVKMNGETITCPKGSHGFNAIATRSEYKCLPYDSGGQKGHGTHVSGIIGAMGGNKFGVKGVSWNGKLIGLKFIGYSGGTVVAAVNAIEFALQLRSIFGKEANIRILNNSWGYTTGVSEEETLMLYEKLRSAQEQDMLIVTSAGEKGDDNDKKPHYPSNFSDLDNLLAVTAIDRRGGLADIHGSYANTGEKTVHLGAPGSEIYSTYPPDLYYGYYFVNSGTSMAAPFVSGAAALILSTPACADLSGRNLKLAILRGTEPTASLTNTSSRGRLNVKQSIARCRP